MSVVCWDGNTLAADKQATDCDMRVETTKIRLIKSGSFEGEIIAWVGCEIDGAALADWYEQGADPDKWPKAAQLDKESSSRLIVAGKAGCKHYQGTHAPIALKVIEPFRAWGSGRDYAMGALAAGVSAYTAVEIASHFCITCGGGVDSFDVREL